MLKKSLFVASCLAVVGLFGLSKTAEAEELAISPVNGLTRGAPSVVEGVVNPGQSLSIKLGGYKNSDIFSKYVVKFTVDSENKETLLLQRVSTYWGAGNRTENKIFYTKGTESINDSLEKLELTGAETGYETFYLFNYSAKPLRLKLAVNSGLHLRALPCVDFSDIDFNIDNY